MQVAIMPFLVVTPFHTWSIDDEENPFVINTERKSARLTPTNDQRYLHRVLRVSCIA